MDYCFFADDSDRVCSFDDIAESVKRLVPVTSIGQGGVVEGGGGVLAVAEPGLGICPRLTRKM